MAAAHFDPYHIEPRTERFDQFLLHWIKLRAFLVVVKYGN